MEKIQSLKGTYDILPEESYEWQYIEEKVRQSCEKFGYREIRIPVFERTELFQRGVGGTTDIVQKEMYTFTDSGKRSLSLRPEGTAGVVRSALEHSLLAGPLPLKVYYLITCYRNEKPQAGRFREFRQFGVEVLGSSEPVTDAEIISLAVNFLDDLGLKNLSVNINSIGCPVCRAQYNETLMEYFKSYESQLCHTCKDRLKKNPLRILDCKEENCKKITKNAPRLLDYICQECADHFEKVKQYLEIMGIQYKIDTDIVRGLDYYTKTVFEIISSDLGAQSTVCGGGRYDGLVQELGGPQMPGIGFGLGLERLKICMKEQGISIPKPAPMKLYVVTLGEKADLYSVQLVDMLRKNGISAGRDCMNRGLKAQMRYADKIGAEYTVVLGDNEIESGEIVLKHMESGNGRTVKLDELVQELK